MTRFARRDAAIPPYNETLRRSVMAERKDPPLHDPDSAGVAIGNRRPVCVRQDETPGLLRPDRPGIIDADSRTLLNQPTRHPVPVILDPQARTSAHLATIQLAIDSQLFGQSSGTGDSFDPANQDRGRMIGGPGDQIQHLVDPVTEVNVPNATRKIENFRPLRAALAGMTGQIPRAVIGLHFDDA